MANVVGERFQITVDKKVREALGVAPGDLALERVEDGRLVIEFIPRPHSRSMRGALRPHLGEPVLPIADWRGIKDRAWEVRSAEISDVLRRDSDRHRHDRHA